MNGQKAKAKVRWSKELEQTMLIVQGWVGTDWELMHRIYFPGISPYSLKNKYYKLIRQLPPFEEQPTFKTLFIERGDREFAWPLRYQLPEVRPLIPDVQPLKVESRFSSGCLEWKADQFESDSEEFEDLCCFL